MPKATLSKMKNSRIYSPGTTKSVLLISFFILALPSVIAQQTQRVVPAVVEADTRYRIGAGDVLEVRVLRAPELSRDAVRVDQLGMIRMPMLDVDIPAACLTEPEVAQNIAKLYLKYKKEPHVDVFVKKFQSQPVAVIGAVRN